MKSTNHTLMFDKFKSKMSKFLSNDIDYLIFTLSKKFKLKKKTESNMIQLI